MSISLNCNGRMFYAEGPVVMGIINATPDSFYTKGTYNTSEGIVAKAGQMISEGALILDVGGMSTRPGSIAVSEDEEIQRVVWAINAIKAAFPQVFISVDTYRSNVAKAAVAVGADMINDISAGEMDIDMIATVASLNVPYILMHMQGTPQEMQLNPQYEDVTVEVFDYCKNKIQECYAAGIKDVIIDPGFGFGKTIAQNYRLLKQMHVLQQLEVPVLAGISRKSMLYKLLDITPEESLPATAAMHTICLQQGAKILRVHDVKEAKQVIDMMSFIESV